MKLFRYIFGVFILGLSLLAPKIAYAQNPQNFTIDSFKADYYLDKNYENASTLEVKETITALFPSYDQNHGILRAIPENYQNHTLSLNIKSVTDQNGSNIHFTTYKENNNKVLKIGDADSYVHGRVTYKINYTLQDVTSYFGDHDELFWDINGDQWQQYFGSVTATIHISKSLSSFLEDRQICYAGTYGNTGRNNCTINRNKENNETIIKAAANNLGPWQTLSVVLGFKQGTFNQKSKAVQKERMEQQTKLIINGASVILLPSSAAIFMFRRWRQFGDDPKGRGVIIPEYEPPKDLDVLELDFLFTQKLRNQAVSALLIDLAVHGFLDIYEIPKKGIFGSKDYELELHNVPQSISTETKETIETFFNLDSSVNTRKVKLSDIKNEASKSMRMYNGMKKAETGLANSLFNKNYFIKDPHKVRQGYRIWALLGIFIAPVFIFVGILWGLFLGIFLASAVVFLFSFIMPARTEKGVVVYDALLGLKDYIKLAEADRLRFLQSPEGAERISVSDQFNPKTPEAKVKLFEKLLPYAMLFGLEKNWAKQFETIYTTPPSWYHGDYTSFNSGVFAGSLSDFGKTTSTSFSSPSSSSGSGFSGGGAGGGGGGGGGGGW